MKRFLTLVLGAGLLGAVMPAVSLAGTASNQMVVARANTPVMRGRSTLATLPAGHRFDVIRREGSWLGMQTMVNGRTVSGWLYQGNVATPQQFAQRTTARRYSYAPVVPGADRGQRGPYPYAGNTLPPDMREYSTGGVRSNSPLIMGWTTFGRNYWRADRKIIGY